MTETWNCGRPLGVIIIHSNLNLAPPAPCLARNIDLLGDLRVRHHLAYMFISHNLRVVKSLSDEIVLMRESRIIKQGSSQGIFEDRKHPYTR